MKCDVQINEINRKHFPTHLHKQVTLHQQYDARVLQGPLIAGVDLNLSESRTQNSIRLSIRNNERQLTTRRYLNNTVMKLKLVLLTLVFLSKPIHYFNHQ